MIDALPGAADLRQTLGIERAVRSLLLGGVMPLWLGAGLADWYLHRRTRIEETTGPRESLIHHLMFAETGIPVLPGLFCEVNAGVLAAAYAATGAHWATAYWDQAPQGPQRAARTTTPYREYRAQLAGRPVEDTLKRAADFLSRAHAGAAAHR